MSLTPMHCDYFVILWGPGVREARSIPHRRHDPLIPATKTTSTRADYWVIPLESRLNPPPSPMPAGQTTPQGHGIANWGPVSYRRRSGSGCEGGEVGRRW
jgi:hypothetical protein